MNAKDIYADIEFTIKSTYEDLSDSTRYTAGSWEEPPEDLWEQELWTLIDDCMNLIPEEAWRKATALGIDGDLEYLIQEFVAGEGLRDSDQDKLIGILTSIMEG